MVAYGRTVRIMYCVLHGFYVVQIITFSDPSSCCSFLVLDLGDLESLGYDLRGTWVSAGTSSSYFLLRSFQPSFANLASTPPQSMYSVSERLMPRTGHADLVLTNLSSGHAVMGVIGGNLLAGDSCASLLAL